jgi:DMSO/TMAO reductase YedYZ molybdopterin-dependent catalytic subunit
MHGRREVLKGIAGATVIGAGGVVPRLLGAAPLATGSEGLPSGAVDSAVLEALPGKRALIKRTFRPPNYETPVGLFDPLYTPNDAFFVRWHLGVIPTPQAADWRLRIGGDSVATPREFTLAELQRDFEQVEVAAVCQCAGNRRGLFQPHVTGVQWGYGGMGNALWRGVRLKDVLAKAGLRADALEVTFDGGDAAVIGATPDFVKSLPVGKALDEHTLIAFAMNGQPLPHWNGHPARLVVPGWTATYWVKQLTTINVVPKAFDGFWMKTAYRLPRGLFPALAPFASQETEANAPVTEMVVNSLITNMKGRKAFHRGQPIEVRGIAWDGGHGIRTVDVSTDGGRAWHPVTLGDDAGRFSWRPWRFRFRPPQPGPHALQFRATNNAGAMQGDRLIANPAGYHHNLVQTVDLVVA